MSCNVFEIVKVFDSFNLKFHCGWFIAYKNSFQCDPLADLHIHPY
jgi:hypothetical protein